MRDFMNSPALALVWDIWARKRKSILWLMALSMIGLTAAAMAALMGLRTTNAACHDQPPLGLCNVDHGMMFVSFLLLFTIFAWEDSGDRTFQGFPRRLLTLPVSTFKLVALPTLASVVATVVAFTFWARAVLGRGGPIYAGPILFATYMVVYQFVNWNLAWLRAMRLVVLGVIAIVFIVANSVVTFPNAPYTVTSLCTVSSIIAVITFLGCWALVARQRSGAAEYDWITGAGRKLSLSVPIVLLPYLMYELWRNGFARFSLARLLEFILLGWSAVRLYRTAHEVVLDRSRPTHQPFNSAQSAQFWFEWRRSGMILPLIVAAILLSVILPVSWYSRNDIGNTLWILGWTLAMPVILAAPIGKASSKPDLWSGDLSLPAQISVLPLSSSDLVQTKVRVALASTAAAWAQVLIFLALWLPGWANAKALRSIRTLLSIYSASVLAQFAIAAVLITAAALITWRFMVSGLWLGLSGNNFLFGATALVYPILLVPGVIALREMTLHAHEMYAWVHPNLERITFKMELVAVIALIAKVSLLAYASYIREDSHLRMNSAFWRAGTAVLVTFVIVFSISLSRLVPQNMARLRTVLIFFALLAIPVSRFSVATWLLERNRHR